MDGLLLGFNLVHRSLKATTFSVLGLAHRMARFSHILLFALVSVLFSYRIMEWSSLKTVLSELCGRHPDVKIPVSTCLKNEQTSPSCLPSIVLCNLNPIRGSSLYFSKPEQRKRPYASQSVSYAELLANLTDDQAENLSHQMPSMLKSCLIGSTPCTSEQFRFARTTQGPCFARSLNSSHDEQIQLVLDPEVHDYLLPNNGLIGFRMAVLSDFSRLNEPSVYTFVVGTRFHTLVDVRDFMKDVASSSSMVLSMMSSLADAQNATVQDVESADQELELVDSFFKVKSIVSPRSTILRDILKTAMKLHVQLTNTSTNVAASGNHCRNLIEHYVDQLRLIGSRASSALTLTEHVNNELHSLIRHNRMVRVSFPGTIPENNLDTLVVVTLQLTNQVRRETRTCDLFQLRNLRSDLLSIIINTVTLYLSSFVLIQLLFTRCRKSTTVVQPHSSGQIITHPTAGYTSNNQCFSSTITVDSQTQLDTMHPCEYCSLNTFAYTSTLSKPRRLSRVFSAKPEFLCETERGFDTPEWTTARPNRIAICQPIVSALGPRNKAEHNEAFILIPNRMSNRSTIDPEQASISSNPELCL
ncbi:hypothetical protein CLF_110254 [Clonorchis sinensis]|uniref:Uncharacterized protein n=1 Tax=Clonorchis sinensis TaxID=79923 RepID=G7YTB4_CLOSI|nr:hypothetical protein CLF_110254 [Clonorchis sinensis]